MRISLQRVSPAPLSCYDGKPLPDRMCWLHPNAVASFGRLQTTLGGAVFSDMYRDADSSLKAYRSGRGAQRPSWSAHGYGLAFDLDIDETLKRWRAHAVLSGLQYADLLTVLASEGWYCHRRDGLLGSEAWHFNYLADHASDCLANTSKNDHKTWANAASHLIVEYYPALLTRMSVLEIQSALTSLDLDVGDLDGCLGAHTQGAMHAFAGVWGVDDHGLVFERTLRFVAASIDHTP